MDRKNALHAFAIADPANREGLVQPVAPASKHDPRENLDALLIPFNNLRVHPHSIPDAKIAGAFAKLFRFNFIK